MRLKNRLSNYPKEPRKDLRDLVRVSAENHGDKVLYAYKRNKEECTCTYREFYEGINKLGSAFKAKGLEGAHIAVIGETSPWWIIAYMAIIASGNTVVPMDKELSPSEIGKFLEVADAAALRMPLKPLPFM